MSLTDDSQQQVYTTPIQETLIYQLSRTYFELIPTFERFMGLSRARWHLISVLSDKECLSQAQLAQLLRVDGAAITRQVKQLEEDGLVLRRADPQDNRFTLVSLTSAGRELYNNLRERRQLLEQQVIAGLSKEEIEQLKQGLQRLRANIQAIQEQA